MDVSITIQPQAPAGTSLNFRGSAIPFGYLAEDGAVISRTTYARLFAAVGTTYGAGDGSTTFQLPDSRGRADIGSGTGAGLSPRSLGATGGAETHLLTASESGLRSHNHSASSDVQGSHTHTVDTRITGSSTIRSRVTSGGSGNSDPVNTTDVSTAGAHSHSITVDSAAAADAVNAHNNMQPFLVVTKIIKY